MNDSKQNAAKKDNKRYRGKKAASERCLFLLLNGGHK